MARGIGGRDPPPGLREQLSDDIALWRLDGGKGEYPSDLLPMEWMRLARLARSWGVTPWSITGEDPTPDVVTRWVRRGLFMQSLDGG